MPPHIKHADVERARSQTASSTAEAPAVPCTPEGRPWAPPSSSSSAPSAPDAPANAEGLAPEAAAVDDGTTHFQLIVNEDHEILENSRLLAQEEEEEEKPEHASRFPSKGTLSQTITTRTC